MNILPSPVVIRNTIPLLLCLCFTGDITAAEIYKYVDENGNLVYSDSPPVEGAEPAQLPDIIIQPSTAIPEQTIGEEQQTNAEISVSISSPVPDTVVTAGQQSFNVGASSSRSLEDGEKARLLVNGNVHTEGKSLNWTVGNLIRGEYNIQVQIVDKQNNVIADSGATKIYVRRPGIR